MTIWAARDKVGATASPETIRSFRLLLIGSSVSMLGTRLTSLAFPMLILWLTRSPVDAGWAAFATTGPSILVYLPAGALVDRRDPRRVMLCSEFGRGLAVTGIVAMVLCWRSIPLLLLAAAVEECLEVFSSLAERRYVGSMIEREYASSALGRFEGRTHAMIMMGRPLGGLLFEIGLAVPFLVDVLTFIFSFCVLLGIKGRPTDEEAVIAELSKELDRRTGRALRRPHQPLHRPIWGDIHEGMTWIAGNRFARAAVTLSAGTTLICQALIIVFIAEAHARQMSSTTIGVILAMSGAGGALGSVIAARLKLPARHSLIKVQILVWSTVISILVASGGRSATWMAAVMGILGFMGAMGNVEIATYLVHNAKDKLARVTSIERLISFTACAIGPVIGGYLFEQSGVQGAATWLLLIILVCGAYSALTPSMQAHSRQIADNQNMQEQS